jgi:hypothetical protein
MKTSIFFLLILLLNSALAMTADQEATIEIQRELDLSDSDAALVEEILKEEKDVYAKGRIFFCAEAGVAAILDVLTLTCRTFKKERFDITMGGLGASISGHAGLAIMYPKKKSRNLKEGTYDGVFSAVHLGLGIVGLNFNNKNETINYRIRGLSVGIGFNAALGWVFVDKL